MTAMDNIMVSLSLKKSHGRQRSTSGSNNGSKPNWKEKIKNKRKSLIAVIPYSSMKPQPPPPTVSSSLQHNNSSNNQEECRLAQLPPEILLDIFSFLDFASLYPLKVAGSRYLTSVANSIPRPSSAEYLLQVQNIILDSRNVKGRSALHLGVLWQQEKLVEGLLSRHSRATSQDSQGNTPLHDAAVLRLNSIAGILIDNRRYTIFVRNQEGQIPLHLAVRNSNESLITLMMKYGNGDQMVRITDIDRRTPLHYAAEAGQQHIVSRLLKGSGNRVLDKDVNGNSSLHLAAANGHLETLRLLLKKKHVTLTERNKAGKTCLHMACANGHEEMVYFLASMSSLDVGSRDNVGNTPLHEVARNGSDELIRMLLHMEMNPSSLRPSSKQGRSSQNSSEGFWHLNFRDKRSRSSQIDNIASTKLHFAASLGSVVAVGRLLGEGAASDAVDVNNFIPLHRAALSGSEPVVARLLSMSGLSARDNINRTALHLAVGVEAIGIAKLLLRMGSDVNAKDSCGNTPLHIAATIGNEQVLQLLLEQAEILVNDTNDQKDTPLHKASKAGNITTVQLLLQRKADVNAQNKCGANALMFAVEYGHSEVVKALVDGESPIMQKRIDGKRALDIATAKWKATGTEDSIGPQPKPSEFILRRLLEKLAGPHGFQRSDIAEVTDVAEVNTRPLLHLAAQLGELEIVRIATERRNAFEGSTLNKNGEPAIFLAAMHGHEETVRFLSGKGCLDTRLAVKLAAKAGCENAIRLLLQEEPDYPRLTGDFGEALCVAAQGGHFGIVKLLLQKGADPKIRDFWAGYPIISAAQGGNVDIIELLLSRGAKVDTRDVRDLPNNLTMENTPLLAAIIASKPEAIHCLLRHGAEFDDLIQSQAYPGLLEAAETGNKGMIELLLSHDIGEKPPAYDRDGILQPGGPSMLSAASKGGHEDIIKMLISKPNVNINSPCKYSRPPLTEAIVGGHENCVKLLLDLGADVNAVYLGPNTFPETALIVAATKGSENVMKMLLDAGADPNIVSATTASNASPKVTTMMASEPMPKTRTRYSPLAEAAASGHATIVRMLIEKGADVNFESGRRGTPLRTAACHGHKDVVKVLLEHNALLNHLDSPLVAAAREEQTEIVRILLEARSKAQFDKSYDAEKDFISALRAACENGHEFVVRLMLDAENAKHREDCLTTALMACLRTGHNNLARVILEIGDSYLTPNNPELEQALKLAVTFKAKFVVNKLLEIGVDSSAVDSRVVRWGSAWAVKADMQRAQDPPTYFHFNDAKGNSRYMLRSQHSSSTAANAVVAIDGVDVQNDDQREEEEEQVKPESPHGTSATSEDSVSYGRYLSFIEESGSSQASGSGGKASAYLRIATFLLENGASIHEQDNMGRTPLIAALEGKRKAVGVGADADVEGQKEGSGPDSRIKKDIDDMMKSSWC